MQKFGPTTINFGQNFWLQHHSVFWDTLYINWERKLHKHSLFYRILRLMDAEPKLGQLDLYSSMVRVKRFTRLHHPLFYHFMSLHLCSKKVITNVWYLFCSQIQLSSLSQFQITPLSDVHNSKSSSNALCLQKKKQKGICNWQDLKIQLCLQIRNCANQCFLYECFACSNTKDQT